MKKILAVILSFMFLLGCSRSDPMGARLEELGSAIEERPDSVLDALRALPADSVTGDRNRALYALLMSHALYKNYIDVTDDSLAMVAVDYFSDGGEPRYEMLSQFCLGRVRFNAEDFSGSLLAMFKAFDIARQLDDPLWIATTARAIGDNYKTAYSGNEAIIYYKIALENFVRHGDKRYLDSALENFVRSYNNSKQHDSCIIIAEKLLDLDGEGFMGLHVNDPEWRHVITYSIGTSQFSLKRYSDAAKTFEKMCNSPFAQNFDSLWYGLSKVRAGKLENVNSIIKNCCKNDSDMLCCELKFRYYEAIDSPRQALKYLKLVNIYSDDDLRRRIYQNMSGPVIQLLESQKAAKQAVIEHNRIIHFSVIFFLSIILILMILYIRYRMRRQRETISNNLEIVEDLQRSLSLKESEIVTAHDSIKRLLGDRYRYFGELCGIYYNNADKDTAKKISDELLNFAREMSSKSKIDELEAMVNSHFANVFENFRHDLPNLSEIDYRLFLFTILGFSSNAIALFLNIDKITAVYDRRRKIKQKIKMLDDAKSSLYLSFFK